MIEVSSFVRVQGLTLATAENQSIAYTIPRVVHHALEDIRAESRPIGTFGRLASVRYRNDPAVQLETRLWHIKHEGSMRRVVNMRLGVYDQDGGAEFESPIESIPELNLSTDAVLLYILGFYTQQYSPTNQ